MFERKHDSLKQIAATEQTQEEQTLKGLPVSIGSHEMIIDEGQDLLGSSEHEEEKTIMVSGEPQTLSPATAQVEARRAKRKSRYEEVIRLHEQGVSQVAIAEMVGLNRDTVRRSITAPAFPEIMRPKCGSKLDPYKAYLHQRWAEGQQNVTHVIKEIRAQGYQGDESIVHDYLKDKTNHSRMDGNLPAVQRAQGTREEHDTLIRTAGGLALCLQSTQAQRPTGLGAGAHPPS